MDIYNKLPDVLKNIVMENVHNLRLSECHKLINKKYELCPTQCSDCNNCRSGLYLWLYKNFGYNDVLTFKKLHNESDNLSRQLLILQIIFNITLIFIFVIPCKYIINLFY